MENEINDEGDKTSNEMIEGLKKKRNIKVFNQEIEFKNFFLIL